MGALLVGDWPKDTDNKHPDAVPINIISCLAGVAQWTEHPPMHQEGSG